MNVERWLQGLVVLLSIISAGVLCWVGDATEMFMVVAIGAISALVFCDWLGWIRLNRTLVNIASLGALFIFGSDFFGPSRVADAFTQLMSIGQLLMWWQIVMLFQQKSPRVYWCIAVLSLLETVVASILNAGLQIGPVFVGFHLVALAALLLFHIYRESQRLDAVRKASSERIAQHASSQSDLLLGGPPIIAGDQSAKTVTRRVGWARLASPMVLMASVSLAFAALFFYGAPRRDDSNWTRHNTADVVETGFTESLSFQQMGRVLQGVKIVMRAEFRDARTDERYELSEAGGGPYFHGSVLDYYNPEEEEWTSGPIAVFPVSAVSGATVRETNWRLADAPNPEDVPPELDYVVQNIQMQPTTRKTLFAVAPAYWIEDAADGTSFWFNYQRQQLFRKVDEQQVVAYPALRFRVATSAFQGGAQRDIRPHGVAASWRLDSEERERLTSFPADRMPGIQKIADDIVASSSAQDNRLLIARNLRNHFLTDPDYKYTLDFTEVGKLRDDSKDPIEDFVTNHKQGHCQYYAAGLAMMLRSQGIPARVVVGYRGGDYNRFGGYYLVRELHAHAWVEAYLEPEDVPDNLRTVASFGKVVGGAWMRLDATPAASEEVTAGRENALDDVLDYARLLWSDYVVELDSERQNQSMSAPLLGNLQALRRWFNLDSIGAYFRRFWVRVADAVTGWLRGGVSWREGLAVFLIGAALVGLIAGARRIWQRIRARRRLAAERDALRSAVRVDFFERLERLLVKAGMPRQATQTQREWADDAGRRFTADSEYSGLADTPWKVVRAFYQVRYGRRELQPAERREVQDALDRMEESIT